MGRLLDEDAVVKEIKEWQKAFRANCHRESVSDVNLILDAIKNLPPAQPEDYTELKREFLRMSSYIDVLLECSDEQKETLLGFISRMSEFMPWTERD